MGQLLSFEESVNQTVDLLKHHKCSDPICQTQMMKTRSELAIARRQLNRLEATLHKKQAQLEKSRRQMEVGNTNVNVKEALEVATVANNLISNPSPTVGPPEKESSPLLVDLSDQRSRPMPLYGFPQQQQIQQRLATTSAGNNSTLRHRIHMNTGHDSLLPPPTPPPPPVVSDTMTMAAVHYCAAHRPPMGETQWLSSSPPPPPLLDRNAGHHYLCTAALGGRSSDPCNITAAGGTGVVTPSYSCRSQPLHQFSMSAESPTEFHHYSCASKVDHFELNNECSSNPVASVASVSCSGGGVSLESVDNPKDCIHRQNSKSETSPTRPPSYEMMEFESCL